MNGQHDRDGEWSEADGLDLREKTISEHSSRRMKQECEGMEPSIKRFAMSMPVLTQSFSTAEPDEGDCVPENGLYDSNSFATALRELNLPR